MGAAPSFRLRRCSASPGPRTASKKYVLVVRKRCHSPEIAVYHFIPPLFPLEPVLKIAHTAVLRNSWNSILKGNSSSFNSSAENGRTGLVVYYDEFYKRLLQKDGGNWVDDFFPGIKAKGGILQRIINYLCSMDAFERSTLQRQLQALGKKHTERRIKPWMYHHFSQTLVETVMCLLGPSASPHFFEAWAFSLSFCLHIMVKQTLKYGPAEFHQMERLQHCSSF